MNYTTTEFEHAHGFTRPREWSVHLDICVISNFGCSIEFRPNIGSQQIQFLVVNSMIKILKPLFKRLLSSSPPESSSKATHSENSS